MNRNRGTILASQSIFKLDFFNAQYRDDSQNKMIALKEKSDKELLQYNMDLKVGLLFRYTGNLVFPDTPYISCFFWTSHISPLLLNYCYDA